MTDPLLTATLASRKRACELGAQFIENDLRKLRTDLRRLYENYAGDYGERTTHEHPPVTTSHEGDVMKAMEWASAATWLRAMAREEE